MRCSTLVLIILLMSCSNKPQKPPQSLTLPEINLIIADSIHIPDKLNTIFFSVTITPKGKNNQGIYQVIVKYGNNDAATEITMPQPDLQPILRKSYNQSFLIGFNAGDTTFYPYFLITAERGQTEMKYIKSYSFR
ncbi:MAG: hypothetical protein JSS78_00370 [Bacteroidetes bacterium]|nr:hypothetical protein [Bacteroidota bacterium]